ncbi:hypothetical protein A994_05921 [Methanobacterium formicicum DSM 3637]|uniref:Uncharacterized protein n=2 Tax=Methanobacterium formicicum TaxID=2162 RepID=K2RTA2_METFP|nr:hypothetical protein A994_05921 [Methanobacterium formicicum DSM 3637]
MIKMNEIRPIKLIFKYESFNEGYSFSLKWEDKGLIIKQLSKNQSQNSNQNQNQIIEHDQNQNHNQNQSINQSLNHNQNEQKIIPSNEEWEDFWYYLDEIKIWDWYEDYRVTCRDSCVEDDEWEVDIVFGDIKVESHGANSYPPTFREFLKAIEELTGILIEFIQQD